MRVRPSPPWIACLAAGLALSGIAGCTASTPPRPVARPVSVDFRRPAAVPEAPVLRVLSPADIAARALPAVVTIRTGDALGTGFVVRADGWIATNLHVIVGGSHAKVTLQNERELDVIDVLAMSPEHDLALIRVDARGLSVLPIGDSDAMRPGDPVVAIGNPMGLEDTVSNGLVSARRKGDDGTEVLQISAPIAPGSSGGPIFNDRGEVIGIAVAILEEGQNLNFGVPARYLAPLLRRATPVPFAQFARLAARSHGDETTKIERNIPHHPVALLDGCNDGAQRLIAQMIQDAVDVGAPLYNQGKPGACYHVYDGAASDLVRKLPPACRGPAHALGDAQRRAAALPNTLAQAWALRDAFDGLIDVIVRKHDKGH
jgi:serine protease Do